MSAGERLVTVLTTLVVPEEADPDDAAALLALAAESTALDVVQSVGVEGHLPVPGATVVRGRQPRPWLVVSLGERGAVPSGRSTRSPSASTRTQASGSPRRT